MKLTCGAIVKLDSEIEKNIPPRGWHINSYGYAVRQVKISGKKINIYLHHMILPVRKGYDVDHINRDKLDNRKQNLRYVTRSQNILNMKPKQNNNSGYTGVIWDKRRNKWRAYIGGLKTRIELGSFNTKNEAIYVRKKAEKDLFHVTFG